jgi:uncharacterized protein (UPF0276 family)
MKFGLGWRAELGAGIVANLHRIDVVEVLAEELVNATKAQRRALRFLREHVTVVLHATSVGLASTECVDRRRLEAVARVVEWLEPELWSEHLAFVRAGGTEVGHLAAPPRNDATLAGLARNVEEARRATGSLPLLENVASLLDPPLSTYDETEWLHAVLAATPCDLLLDLHNAHANATNFGFDAAALVRSLPPQRVRMVHLAGGRRIEGDRILDDHRHPVPDEVYALLAEVRSEEAMVVLERDGEYPAIDELLGEVERARERVGVGCQVSGIGEVSPGRQVPDTRHQTPDTNLAFLTLLYTDPTARAAFAADPYATARNSGFSEADSREFANMNLDDLRIAARGFEKKRALRAPSPESLSRNPLRRLWRG